MVGKDYFKRQAATLRKMVMVTRNATVADRLIQMADDFDTKAVDGSDELKHQIQRGPAVSEGHEGRG